MNEHLQRTEPKPLFDPLSPEFIRDPYPFYERLRMTDPMHLTPLGAYVASRHADVSLILRDKRFGKNFVERMTRRYGPQVMQEPVYRCMRHWRRSRKNIAELHEGRSDPREPPQDISHRASHGLSDAASFGASIFRDLDLFAIEILNYPRRLADSAHVAG